MGWNDGEEAKGCESREKGRIVGAGKESSKALLCLNKHRQGRLNLLYGPYNLYCALGAIFAQTMNTKRIIGRAAWRFNNGKRNGARSMVNPLQLIKIYTI